jgi:hypothetical protein
MANSAEMGLAVEGKAACALAKAASADNRAWLAWAWFWLASWSIKALRAL